MQTATSRIWTLAAESILYDDNRYATSAFVSRYCILSWLGLAVPIQCRKGLLLNLSWIIHYLSLSTVARCWAFVLVGVGVGECQSDSSVCFGAKPTQRACARDLLRDRKKRGKARFQGTTEEDSQQKSGEGDGQRKVAAERGAWTCGFRGRIGQRERISQRSWWLCRNFARIHARDSPQKTTQKCYKLLPSCAWS